MFSYIEQWKQSGLSQKQFCAQHNIVLHSFYYWFKRYREQNNGINGQPANGFVEIQANPSISPGTDIEILLAGGHRIIFNQPVSASFIKEVIS